MAKLNHPGNLKYSKSDEWVLLNGDEATIGITDYAQDQLGDIVYLELKAQEGDSVAADKSFGDIESVKATSELISPVSGDVVKTNDQLHDTPEVINDDPYKQGWMLVVKLATPSELDTLMNADQYLEYLNGR